MREFMDRRFTVRTGTVVIALLAPVAVFYHLKMAKTFTAAFVEELGKTVDANRNFNVNR